MSASPLHKDLTEDLADGQWKLSISLKVAGRLASTNRKQTGAGCFGEWDKTRGFRVAA